MNKFVISLYITIFLSFFTINCAYCEEDFFMNLPNQKATETKVTQDAQTKKSKFLDFFKSKKKKTQKEEDTRGYFGTLPDVNRDFSYKRQQETTTKAQDIITEEEINKEGLKPVPQNDTLFIDNIVKKEKSSSYINDVQRTKLALENLKKCIEQQGDIQRFNGCVYLVDMYSKNLENKYKNQSDCLRDSYGHILSTSYRAKLLGNLMYEANYYARYIPTQQGKYSKDNIEKEKQDLLNKINKTLFLISNEV